MSLIGKKAPIWFSDTVCGTIVKDDGINLWLSISYSKWEGDPQNQTRVRRNYVYKRSKYWTVKRMGWGKTLDTGL